MTRPLFTHDCAKCQFIAAATALGRRFDLYRNCNEGEGYILRFSDEGHDYQSVYPSHGRSLTHLVETGQLAISASFALCQTIEELAK